MHEVTTALVPAETLRTLGARGRARLSSEARAHLDSDDKRRCTNQTRREAELVDAAGALAARERLSFGTVLTSERTGVVLVSESREP